MTRRKVQSSHTSIHRGPLGGVHATTRTYEHTPRAGGSRTSRALAFTGMSPWQPRRAAVSGGVLVWLAIAGQAPTVGWVLLAVAVLVATALVVRRRLAAEPEPEAPKSAPVGAEWCDHCADWTVHATDKHAA